MADRSSSSWTVLSLPAFSCVESWKPLIRSQALTCRARQRCQDSEVLVSQVITSFINLGRTSPFRKCFGSHSRFVVHESIDGPLLEIPGRRAYLVQHATAVMLSDVQSEVDQSHRIGKRFHTDLLALSSAPATARSTRTLRDHWESRIVCLRCVGSYLCLLTH